MTFTRYLILFLSFAYCSYAQVSQNRNRTPAGNFYEWEVLPKDQFGLNWGNATVTRSFPRRFDLQEAFAAFISENRHAIILQGSCGRYCSYGLVLPLDANSPPRRYDNPYDFEMNTNLVVYPYEEDIRSDTTLVVENFLTREKRYLVGQNNIHLAKFQGDSLRYEWFYNSNLMSKTVPLNFGKR